MVQGTTTYFVRGETPASSGKKPSPEPIEAGEWSVEQVVAEDQADRYAPASGDLNPIHIDADVARKAGLPGVILHGLCTMAFAQRDIIDRLADGDPGRLERLAVRWAAPVFPGSSLELRGWGRSEDIRFVTLDERGRPVMVQGRARVRSS